MNLRRRQFLTSPGETLLLPLQARTTAEPLPLNHVGPASREGDRRHQPRPEGRAAIMRLVGSRSQTCRLVEDRFLKVRLEALDASGSAACLLGKQRFAHPVHPADTSPKYRPDHTSQHIKPHVAPLHELEQPTQSRSRQVPTPTELGRSASHGSRYKADGDRRPQSPPATHAS